ncbi:MAG TPA: hypothetical protein VL563_04600 [Gemmatimonadales bacterium]|jgi:hypothetical protein|nr:hypothetical protein [Gemmatimonadales bacterium]
MRRNALITALGLALLIMGVGPAAAQTATAEIRTWTGQTYLLSDPSLAVRYTIMVPKKDEGPGPSDTAPTTGARTPMLFGSANAIGQFLDKQPDPLQGHRQSETITLRKGGTEVRVPMVNVGTLHFTRQTARSPLPPYVASGHYRYAATAELTDGSRIEGDDVSLGTTFLRGRTASGTVDIPWQQIETVRFTR